MNILLTGASGLIGSAVKEKFKTDGHCVFELQRNDHSQPLYWNPLENIINLPLETEVDAVIHLAGESVAGLWSKSKKSRVLNSRVDGTKLLFGHIAKLHKGPKVAICASAVGYYGSQGDIALTEKSPKGTGFLADVCEQWEKATHCLNQTKIRVIHARFGLVLSPNGGLLRTILPQFRLWLGGNIGNGTQYMSWVSLCDVVNAISFIIDNQQIEGAVNITSPSPVRNKEFTRDLSAALKKPAFVNIPALLIQVVLGQMGRELLLGSNYALPSKLEEQGFAFTHSEIKTLFAELFPR